jgi:hypothetical protein
MTAVAACLFSQGSAAQSLRVSLAIESEGSGGYMELGGGLAKAIVKRTAVKAAEARHRVRHAQPSRFAVRAMQDGPPIKFVSQALDQSGLNIIGLTYASPVTTRSRTAISSRESKNPALF